MFVTNSKLQFVTVREEIRAEVASDDEPEAWRTKRGLGTSVSTPHRGPLVERIPRISRGNENRDRGLRRFEIAFVPFRPLLQRLGKSNPESRW